MKEAAKVFATIASLLLGGFCVYDGDHTYGGNPEIVTGLLVIALGLTAIWLQIKRKNSN